MPRFRRSHRRKGRLASEERLRRIHQGEGGERALQDWLDRSRLAYLYLDQTPFTIPTAHRADIKRPDFLVAVDGVGTIAVDAKAKAFMERCFVLDASERRRLDGFESVFGIPVWYACFPPEEPDMCYLFRNRDLIGPSVLHNLTKRSLGVPVWVGLSVNQATTSFTSALRSAIAFSVFSKLERTEHPHTPHLKSRKAMHPCSSP